MIWVVIVIAIIGIILFKIFNRDFVLAIPQNGKSFLVKFESGKTSVCQLIDVFSYNNKDYYVFIPEESLKAIPSEDIIVLKCLKKSDNKIILVFPEQDADEYVLKKFLNKYGNTYNFID